MRRRREQGSDFLQRQVGLTSHRCHERDVLAHHCRVEASGVRHELEGMARLAQCFGMAAESCVRDPE
jgi:hypothetical protein